MNLGPINSQIKALTTSFDAGCFEFCFVVGGRVRLFSSFLPFFAHIHIHIITIVASCCVGVGCKQNYNAEIKIGRLKFFIQRIRRRMQRKGLREMSYPR